MNRGFVWTLAKALEGVGLVIVLVGLVLSVQTGMQDEGMKSMTFEAWGLAIGGGLVFVGLALERVGGRGE